MYTILSFYCSFTIFSNLVNESVNESASISYTAYSNNNAEFSDATKGTLSYYWMNDVVLSAS